MPQRVTITLLLFFTALLSIQSVHAEEEEPRWYQIEIILFEHLGNRETETERWPVAHEATDLSSAIELITEDTGTLPVASRTVAPDMLTPETTAPDTSQTEQPMATQALVPPAPNSPALPEGAYVLLDSSAMQLTPTYQSLGRSSRHSRILHLAWRQPTVDKKQSIPVHIHGGVQYPQEIPVTMETQPDTGNTTPTISPLQPQAGVVAANSMGSASNIEQIDGTITISRARYLHVWTDLIYSTPDAPRGIMTAVENITGSSMDGEMSTATEEQAALSSHLATLDSGTLETGPGLFSFRIQEHRRMRSNEIHYMDHPRIGMIVLATPYEPPVPVQPEEEPVISAPVETSSDATTSNVTR